MKKPKLPRKVKKSTEKQSKKKKTNYKIRNWKEYNESLVNRGSLDLWIHTEVIKDWKITIVDEHGKRLQGSHERYSDKAIELCRLVGKVFHQRLRQTEGFVSSIVRLRGIPVEVPDFSTLSRRGGKIAVDLSTMTKGHVIAIMDSTGLKVYGEGEWKVRKHGYSKHRTWMKMHISIDRDGEIRVVEVTENSVDDATAGVTMLDNQKDTVTETIDDGAYDKEKFYEACKRKGIRKIVIPPRKDAKIWEHGNLKGVTRHPRDENVRAIRKTSRERWKKETGYHARSLIETTMFRKKTIFGEKVYSRSTANQITEVRLECKALNMMLQTGMPDSYPVLTAT